MRVVSLNLDHGDAAVVRGAVRLALDTCRCVELPDRTHCPTCQSLAATLRELDRLVQRPALGRTPLMTLITANGHGHAVAPPPRTPDRIGDPEDFRPLAGDGGGRS